MIPKIIHYCWFGRKDKPKEVEENIANWRKMNPDFVIKEWNEDNFDFRALAFTKEAYAVGKYAFVSDVARLYALYNEGGIYLDTDVRVIKPFEPYLDNHSFVGKESLFLVSTAVLGAEKGPVWVKGFMDKYKKRHFIMKNGKFDSQVNTLSLSFYFNVNYTLWVDGSLSIYDADVFSAKLYADKQYIISERTVSVHEFSSSWMSKPLTLFQRMCNLLIRVKLTLWR